MICKVPLRDPNGNLATNDAKKDKLLNPFIFNAITCLKCHLPYWKVSLITMILKPGKNHTQIDPYRINILPNFSKFLKKIIIIEIYAFIKWKRLQIVNLDTKIYKLGQIFYQSFIRNQSRNFTLFFPHTLYISLNNTFNILWF